MITVRTADQSDGAAFAAIYAPIVRDTVISFEIDPPSADDMACRVADTLPRFAWLTAERDGEVIGYACGKPHGDRAAYRWSTEFGVYVAESARGRGVGARLYAALIAVSRRQGYHSAFAGITLPNAASVALHESVGFYRQGVFDECGFKFGAWHDVGRWRLALSEGPPAHEPVPFADLMESPELTSLLATSADRSVTA